MYTYIFSDTDHNDFVIDIYITNFMLTLHYELTHVCKIMPLYS